MINNIVEMFYAEDSKLGRTQPHGRGFEQHGADPAAMLIQDRVTGEQKAVQVSQH